MTVSRRLFISEHEMLGKSIRDFVEREVTPQVAASEEAGRIPVSSAAPMGSSSR
jgi:Acyl-CoA dehydrogenase, N-terminal domain